MVSSDGKYYKTDVADTEQLFGLITRANRVLTAQVLVAHPYGHPETIRQDQHI
jgi:hypothetical protein